MRTVLADFANSLVQTCLSHKLIQTWKIIIFKCPFQSFRECYYWARYVHIVFRDNHGLPRRSCEFWQHKLRVLELLAERQGTRRGWDSGLKLIRIFHGRLNLR